MVNPLEKPIKPLKIDQNPFAVRCFFLILSLFAAAGSFAQTDTIYRIPAGELTPSERIAQSRQFLRAAFIDADDAAVDAWLDTLTLMLEDSIYAATQVEERWLLWYWTGRYQWLFADVLDYDQHYRYVQSQKLQPPADGLMAVIDEISAADAFELYRKIGAARLSPEEMAFAALHLEYLLTPRPSIAQIAEQDDKAVAFLQKFPRSRFGRYVREFMYNGSKSGNSGGDFDLLFVVARPDGRRGLNFKTSFGGSVGYKWWRNRFSLGGRLGFTGQGTARDFALERTDVAKDSVSISIFIGPEAGYTLFDRKKIRFTPICGSGLGWLNIPARRDAEFAYRENYLSYYFNLGFTVDYRFGRPKRDDEWISGASAQYGLRLNVGYQKPGFGGNDRALQGGLFYVGLGLDLLLRKPYVLPGY